MRTLNQLIFLLPSPWAPCDAKAFRLWFSIAARRTDGETVRMTEDDVEDYYYICGAGDTDKTGRPRRCCRVVRRTLCPPYRARLLLLESQIHFLAHFRVHRYIDVPFL